MGKEENKELWNKEWRKKNPEYWKKYAKTKKGIAVAGKAMSKYLSKPENREKVRQRRKRYLSDPINLEKHKKYMKKYLKEYKLDDDNLKKIRIRKNTARDQRRIRNELGIKRKCSVCSSTSNLEIHHEEYIPNTNKITDLCISCHGLLRRK